MEYRQLGGSGLQVSIVGLGCNTFGRYTDEAGTASILYKAIDLGINFIDTANSYGLGTSEQQIGSALAGGRRKELLIGTKGGVSMGAGPNLSGASRHHLMTMLEDSLRRLQTDYVDLYQVHRYDATTPPEETMRALDDMVSQGKVRYIGCSNYTAWQVCEAQFTARSNHLMPFVTVQPQYNLFDRSPERELLPYCEQNGLGVLPYYPLAGGFLTGKYRRGEPIPEGTRGNMNPASITRWSSDSNYDILEQIQAFAAQRGHSTGELAIAWLLAKPAISCVIAGTTKPAQVEANVQAAGWTLTTAEAAELDELTRDN